MSITGLALKLAAPVPKIEGFQRYLFIGPHPDDIEIGAGGTAAKLAHMGKDVCFLICIDGRYGDGAVSDMDRDSLISLRQREALASAKLLGVSDVRFLGLCDGGFYDIQDLEKGIARVIGDFKPDCIFAPDPWVSSECHKDHLNVGRAASQLAYMAPYPGVMGRYGASTAPAWALCLYMTARPNAYVKTKGWLSPQLEAIFSCHLSQFPQDSQEGKAIKLYLRLRSADMGLRCGCTAAEGFRALGRTHMHCLPEAGNR